MTSGFALKDSVHGFRRDVAMGFAVEQCWRVLSIVANNDIQIESDTRPSLSRIVALPLVLCSDLAGNSAVLL